MKSSRLNLMIVLSLFGFCFTFLAAPEPAQTRSNVGEISSAGFSPQFRKRSAGYHAGHSDD